IVIVVCTASPSVTLSLPTRRSSDMQTGESLPEPSFDERIRVMCRHLDLMIDFFGEARGCRMFRRVAKRYSTRFGPSKFFNRLARSEEHTTELQSRENLVFRLQLAKK